MTTGNDIRARAEKQECTSAISALGLTLLQALVADESGLLISSKAGDGNTLESTVRDLAVDLRRRGDLGKHRCLETEEVEQNGIELQSIEVQQVRTRCVSHVGDVHATLSPTSKTLREREISVSAAMSQGKFAYVNNPGLDSAEAKIVLIVRLTNCIPVIDHPADLESREVGRKRQASAV